jgi:lysophospholipase L1-like esterase
MAGSFNIPKGRQQSSRAPIKVTGSPVLNAPYRKELSKIGGKTIAVKQNEVSEPSGEIPLNTVLPDISGTPSIGELLSATTGTWTGSPTSFSYQWNRNGAPIGGATASTYSLVDADDGTDITVTVTASNELGSTPATSTAVQIREFTNSLGQQAFLVIGDSIARGTSEAPGPTAAAGTMYEWDGSSLVELTTADVSAAASGSMWKQFGINYNAATSRKPVMVCTGVGGTSFENDGSGDDWSSDGTLYGPAVTKTNGCLSALGVTKLKGVIIILGINDARGSTLLTDIQTAINSLRSRLDTDFPDTQIYIASIGRAESGVLGTRISSIKGYIKDLADTYTNVHIVLNLTSFVGWGLYSGDGLHLSQAGNNKGGELIARYMVSTESNKEARQVIGTLYSDVTSTRKTAIKSFIEGCVSDGNWDLLDYFQFYLGQVQNDTYVGWKLNASGAPNGTIGFVANSHISTPGTVGNNLNTHFAPFNARRATQNDCLTGIRFGTVTTPAGTAGHAHSAAGENRLFQASGSVIGYGVNDLTGTTWTGGDTKFANDTEYSRGRDSSTNKFLKKNGTQVHTATVASITPTTDYILVGQASGSTAYLNAEYKYSFYSKNAGFNHAAFITRVETLITAWNS